MAKPALDRLFAARSVAVIGASRHPGKVGNSIVVNLKKSEFQGHVYPVNPAASSVAGYPCYPDITAVPSVPDVAVVVVPASVVIPTVKACGEKGIPFLIIISAGFKETGSEGARREQELKSVIQQYDMRVVGPNCLGVLNPHRRFNATFASPQDFPTPGGLAFISQSGALGTAILDVSVTNPLFGLSSFVSLGNKVDIDEAELLEYFAHDPKTQAIALYVEGLTDGQRFVQAARRVSRAKPIVMLKSGRSSSGQKAISSHTGSLAGNEVVYDVALATAGVIRVTSFQELIDVSTAVTHLPRLRQNRIAIITNAGGPAILATDAIQRHPLVLSQLHNVTTRRLERFLPDTASVHNPIDILGDALSDRYRGALDIIGHDSSVDAVLVILTPQSMTDISEVAEVIAETARRLARPIIACFMGERRVEVGRKLLAEAKVPVFEDPDQAVAALAGLYKHTYLREIANETWLDTPRPPSLATRRLLELPPESESLRLSLMQSLDLLGEIEIPVARTQVVTSLTQAEELATRWQWPVVLKIDSPDLNHKSDKGGVVVGIRNRDELATAYKQLSTLIEQSGWSQADIVIQNQVTTGQQFIVGAHQDPTFGPVITVGLGGIYVEVFKDAVNQLAPVSVNEARRMLAKLKSYPLLSGARGQAKADIAGLAKVVSAVSHLVAACPELNQLDINPVFVQDEQVIAVDARVILAPAQRR